MVQWFSPVNCWSGWHEPRVWTLCTLQVDIDADIFATAFRWYVYLWWLKRSLIDYLWTLCKSGRRFFFFFFFFVTDAVHEILNVNSSRRHFRRTETWFLCQSKETEKILRSCVSTQPNPVRLIWSLLPSSSSWAPGWQDFWERLCCSWQRCRLFCLRIMPVPAMAQDTVKDITSVLARSISTSEYSR